MTNPHMSIGWTWAFDTPFKWTKQIAGYFGGTKQGTVDRLAEGDHRQGRHPQPVRPCHRRRPDHPRGHRHPRALGGRRHRAEPDGGHQPRLHLRHGERGRAVASPHPVFRDDGRVRALPRGLDGGDQGDAARPGCSAARRTSIRRTPTGNSTTSRTTGRRTATSPRSIRTSSKELQDLFWREAEKYQVLPLDASVATRLVTPRPSITAGRTEFVWTAADDRHAERRRAERAQHLLHLHRRHRGARGRRRRDADHPGRAASPATASTC